MKIKMIRQSIGYNESRIIGMFVWNNNYWIVVGPQLLVEILVPQLVEYNKRHRNDYEYIYNINELGLHYKNSPLQMGEIESMAKNDFDYFASILRMITLA